MVKSKSQLADCLTKGIASNTKIIKCPQEWQWSSWVIVLTKKEAV